VENPILGFSAITNSYAISRLGHSEVSPSMSRLLSAHRGQKAKYKMQTQAFMESAPGWRGLSHRRMDTLCCSKISWFDTRPRR